MELKPVRHVAFVKMIIVFLSEAEIASSPCRCPLFAWPGAFEKKYLLRPTGLFQGLDRSIFSRTTLVDNDFHVLVQDLDLL